MSNMEFSYDKRVKLGSGSPGINVYEGKSMGLIIAVKVINTSPSTKKLESEIEKMNKSEIEKMNKSDTVPLPTSIDILRRITHQNIIRIYNFKVINEDILIPMEYCNKNLSEYLKKSLGIKTKLNILKQIGEGIKYLHARKVCHQKLKPENILIKLPNEEVKLADFGYASYIDRKPASLPTKTTCIWTPPEGYRNEPSVDIYAYGCLIQRVLTDQEEKGHPFGNPKEDVSTLKNVSDAKRVNFLKQQDQTDLLILADLAIDDATQTKANERPDISTFIEHPLFWTPMQKGFFLRDIKNDYHFASTKRKGTLLKDFEALKYHDNKGKQFKWTDKCESLRKLVQKSKHIKQKNKKKYGDRYFNLIALTRNICAHFSEYEKVEGYECGDKNVLDNKTKFIKHVISEYPYLIYDIFTCYRKAVKSGGVYRNDRYNDYFKNMFPESTEDDDSAENN